MSPKFNFKWSVIWVIIHSISLFILTIILQYFNVENGIIQILFIGIGVTIIARLVKRITKKKQFVVDKWFFFWSLINAFIIWLMLLLISLLQITNNLFSLLLMAIGLVIGANFIKKLRITRNVMIITSIILLVVLFLFNSNSSTLSLANSKSFSTQTSSAKSNNILSNIKESTSKLFSQISPSISVSNEDSLSLKCKKSYNNCKEIFNQKYEYSLSLMKMEEFEDKSKAKEFFNTWKFYPVQDDDELDDARFPVVLFVVKSSGPKGQFVGVFTCDNSGDFTERSKQHICY